MPKKASASLVSHTSVQVGVIIVNAQFTVDVTLWGKGKFVDSPTLVYI